MGYDTDESMVRVDFFTKQGKWKYTGAVKWLTWNSSPKGGKLIHDAFREALINYGYHREYMAICLEPFHVHSHPIMLMDW